MRWVQFDIAADVHTPVSALAPPSPGQALESVEGGRLGRFSFIGFGESTRVDVEAGTGDPPGALRQGLDPARRLEELRP
ncbi:MAG TPA: hypothetical protein VID03_03715 [Acidimicrobiia bacterium]